MSKTTTITEECCPEVQDIDAQLERLLQQVFDLRMKRAHIMARNAPIRRVPPEILSHIIFFAIHDKYTLNPSNDFRSLMFLFTAARVCKLWNHIVYDTPALWSRIIVSPTRKSLLWVHQFIQRSASTPLDILVDFRDYSDDPADTVIVKRYIEALKPAMSRCATLAFVTQSESALGAFFETAPPGVAFREVNIISAASVVEAPVKLFESHLPNLRNVTLNKVTCLAWNRVSFAALETLSVRSCSQLPFLDFLQAISASPSLHTLRIESCAFIVDTSTLWNVSNSSLEATIFPRLASLQLVLVRGMDLAMLLENIRSPALKSVLIHVQQEADLCWWSGKTTALETVEDIRFDNLRIRGTALAPLMRMMQKLDALTSLTLVNSAPSEQFFAALGGCNTVASKLSKMTVRRCSGITGHEIVRLAGARRRLDGSSKLERVELLGCPSLDMDAVENLKALVDFVAVSEE